MKLVCYDCGKEEQEPFDSGDECICGGSFVRPTVCLWEDEVEAMADLIMSMFSQGCMMPDGLYSHDCISAWEEAQAWLIEHDMIKPEQCKYQ
jgi:hypothetical protein